MQNGVRIDSQTIRKLSADILNETNKLLQMIDVAKAKVDGSIIFYDNESAKVFRTKMEEFTMNAKQGASTSLTNLAKYFDEVAQAYERADADVLDIANQYLSTEIFQ